MTPFEDTVDQQTKADASLRLNQNQTSKCSLKFKLLLLYLGLDVGAGRTPRIFREKNVLGHSADSEVVKRPS